MDKPNESIKILNLFHHPVFLVKDGIIADRNHAAAQWQIPLDVSVSEFMDEGNEAYETYTGGYLTLGITLAGIPHMAVVIRTELGDLFHIQEGIDAEFRTMALISQKLRQPLSDLMNSAVNLLPDSVIQTNPDLKQKAGQINRSLYQLLREVSNLSIGTLSGNLQLYNVTALFYEIADKVSSIELLQGKRITCEAPQEDLFALINPDLLERAIYNMISNALKFAPADSAVSAKLESSDKRISLSVQNQCLPGSDSDGPFFRYLREPGIEDGRQGIGLGLALVQKAALVHSGCLLMDHPAQDIARFTLTFPIRQTQPTEVSSPILGFDYLGGRDHTLVELSDVLPASAYTEID